MAEYFSYLVFKPKAILSVLTPPAVNKKIKEYRHGKGSEVD
jgi:hypothetical protein